MKKGFRKIDPDRWEFANEGFLRGQKHLLKDIKRRKSPSPSPVQQQALLGPCVEIGGFGLDREIDRLRRDKNILTTELVNLRQQQQYTRGLLRSMEERLQGTEQRQEQMMTFLAKAIQHPTHPHTSVHRKVLEDAITKKRRRLPIDVIMTTRHGGGRGDGETSQSFVEEKPIKMEAGFFEEGHGLDQMSELGALALEIQGFRRIKEGGDEERLGREREDEEEEDEELSDDFWKELLNEKIGEEAVASDARGTEDEDLNCLTERLGDLGS